MGIKDRLKGLKAGLSSGPVDTKLTELGSPDRVAAGGIATINVQVTGENDGTVDRIELVLHTPQYNRIPLADVPIGPGVHPVEIALPADLAPSVSPWTDYSLRARVLRNQGQLEATHGKATGWHLVGVLDPKADAGIRNRKSQGLAGLMTGSPDV